ncbi:hypothetical protein [Chryseobacterium sp.]|uniref:hypothetical protein n=1 Tax=Chryseobacterium sp. TaxID=1871047 RepID=UPI00321ABF28
MEKTLMQKLTLFSMNFDFSTGQQKEILNDLQRNNYKLVGYKGATGNNQITVGVPTWFSIVYSGVFGTLEIDYEPKYKLYAYHRSHIDINTTIVMEELSEEISLGTGMTFNSQARFVKTSDAPEGVITVNDSRPAGSPSLIIGLAAKVDGRHLPFCAFTSSPQEIITIEPNEKTALFALQTNMTPGSLADHINNPGCCFMFSDQNMKYDLQMIPDTYGIENVPGKLPVEPVSPGSSLIQLFSTF